MTFKVDSRSEKITTEDSVYVTSEPAELNWGQPSASRYYFYQVGNRLKGTLIPGTYAAVEQSWSSHVKNWELGLEFAIWDLLSDEALFNFEAELE